MGALSSMKLKMLRAEAAATSLLPALEDPALAYRFYVYVEIDSVMSAAFTQVSGLTMERAVEPYEEGGQNKYVHQLPGRFKQSKITLKRGVTFSTGLWDWFFKEDFATEMKVKKTNMSILHFSQYSAPIVGAMTARWYNLTNAYPVKWSIADFDAGSAQVAVESLELVYEELEVVPQSKSPF